MEVTERRSAKWQGIVCYALIVQVEEIDADPLVEAANMCGRFVRSSRTSPNTVELLIGDPTVTKGDVEKIDVEQIIDKLAHYFHIVTGRKLR